MAISFVGGTTGPDSATMPAHQSGDLILIWAYNETNSTVPTKPAAYTDVISAASGNNGFILGSLIATSSSEVTGTWTGAESILVQIYRSSTGTLSIGSAPAAFTNFGTLIEYGAITLDDTSGSSWVVGFAGHRSNNVNLSLAPTGMVNRTFDTPALSRAGGHDTNVGVTSWSSQSVEGGGSASSWHSTVAEIVETAGGGELLTIDSGSYSLSGTSIALKAEYSTVISSGSYSLSGTATGLIHDSKLISDSGTYSLTGSNVNLITARSALTENGSYNLTGTNVTLVYTPGGGGELLVVDSGVFSLTGSDVGLKTVRYIQTESGDYTLTGQNVSLSYASSLVANNGPYALTGDNVGLFANRVIITNNGSYTLSGTSAVLKYSGDTSVTIGTVSAGFAADKYAVKYKQNSITVNFKD